MKLKRSLSVVLILCLMLTIFPRAVWTEETDGWTRKTDVQVVKPEKDWGAAATIPLEHCHHGGAELFGDNDDGQAYIFLTLEYGTQEMPAKLKNSFDVTEYSKYPIHVYYVNESKQSHEVTSAATFKVQSGNATITTEKDKKWIHTLGKGTAQISVSYLSLEVSCRFDIRKLNIISNRTELVYLALNQFVYFDGVDQKGNTMAGKTIGDILSSGVPHAQADISIRGKDKIGATYKSLFSALVWDWTLYKYQKGSSGFFAAAFYHPSTKEYVIAYRGTQPLEGGDDIADLQILNGFGHTQLTQALDFYNSLRKSSVVLTGYSLGGALANYVSSVTHTRAITFNGISSTTSTVNTNTTNFAKNFTGLNNGLKIDYVNPKDGFGQRGIGDNVGIWAKGGQLDRTYFVHDQSSINGTGFGTQYHFFEQMLAYNPVVGSLYLPCDYVTNPTVHKFSHLGKDYIFGSTGSDLQLNISSNSGAYVFGGNGDDVIRSSVLPVYSKEIIYGEYIICGGNGNDTITSSGLANETYYYFAEHNGIDTINDNAGNDKIELYGYSEKAITDDNGFPYVTIFAPGTNTPLARLNRKGTGSYTITNGTSSKTIMRSGSMTNAYRAACPVDMLIHEPSGAVVLELKDGVESDELLDYGSFSVYEQDGEYVKSAILFDEGYTVELLGVGDGVMSYSNAIFTDGAPLVRAVENVPVEKGVAYTALCDADSDVVLEGKDGHDDIVFYAPESINISAAQDVLRYGESTNLTAAVFPEEAVQEVHWSSSDISVASVDENGTVTAVAAGSAVVTAQSSFNEAVTGSYTITVSDEMIPVETAKISGIEESHIFTGNAITPDLVVSLGAYTLLEGVDYEPLFENNNQPGTATVTISGIGHFTGTQSRTFDIRLPSVSEKVEQLLAECMSSGAETDRDKAIWFHDWLIDHANYDHTYTEYDADGVLLKGTGVCQSYTNAYSALLTAAGIENIVVLSPEMDHAWNIVYMDGVYTHVDCTWDDPNSGGLENHFYFGLGDSEMAQDHIWDRDKYPVCQMLPFHADESALPAPFDLSNPIKGVEFTLQGADGNIITREDVERTEGNILLVFGRTSCSNTMALLRSLRDWSEVLTMHNVQVVAVMEDASQARELSEQFDFVCGYNLDEYELWQFNQSIELTGSYTYPQVVLQNSSGYACYNSTGYVYEPEKLVATAINELPESAQVPYSPVQIYSTQDEMKELIRHALESRMELVKVCNLSSYGLSDEDVDTALEYIYEAGIQYGGYNSWYSPFFGAELVIGLEYVPIFQVDVMASDSTSCSLNVTNHSNQYAHYFLAAYTEQGKMVSVNAVGANSQMESIELHYPESAGVRHVKLFILDGNSFALIDETRTFEI